MAGKQRDYFARIWYRNHWHDDAPLKAATDRVAERAARDLLTDRVEEIGVWCMLGRYASREVCRLTPTSPAPEGL